MAIISLFGSEAQALVKPIAVVEKEKVVVKTPRISKPKEPRKAKEETISNLRWEQEESIKRLRELEAQDETNFTDFDKSVKGKEVNMPLVKNHICYYQRQIEKLQEPFNHLLNKWKDFIVNLCKTKGQEIDKIWFDVSAPLDCEIAVRLAGHRCWSACVEFRFQEGQLRAFDSHFGGGTSFIDGFKSYMDDDKTANKITEIMERVFNKECSNNEWESKGDREGDKAHRHIIISPNGWRSEIDVNDYISEREKEERAEMIKEINDKGFIQDGENYTYWTHYGKKQNNIKDFKNLLNDSFYGLIVENKTQEVVFGENQNTQTNTWIITKDFFEYLKNNNLVKLKEKSNE